ncbi:MULTISPECIES: carbohydrate ABC transporter permease [unclassified Streptomyces]|uniref:carbohydrate ABC transporter permease n=1 Tax=unclassified Streptomyces TaxID=2593676 RepID=UPI000B15194E|nr:MULTISPECIES: sugar ABC transporter permease [unclassified Streptomyces]MYS22097.1 ABC transporter permease subunit [Streptomyces sp. SID4948]
MSVTTDSVRGRRTPPSGARGTPPATGRRAAARWRERLMAGGFLLPAAIMVVVVLLAPFCYTLYRSFFSDYAHSTANGLANYRDYFTDPNLLRSLENTLMWVVGAIVLPTGMGLVIAMLTNATRWSRAARLAVTIPYAISGSAVAVVWNFMLTSDGAVNGALRGLHLGSLAGNWLLDWPGNTIVMIIASSWQATGVAVILFMVGLQGIPPDTLEAAALDGAGSWARFRYIVLPQLRPVSIIVIGMSLVNGLKAFDLIFVLTQGGPGRATETLAVSMYQETFLFLRPGAGAAIAVLLTIIVLLASWTYLRRQLPTQGKV